MGEEFPIFTWGRAKDGSDIAIGDGGVNLYEDQFNKCFDRFGAGLPFGDEVHLEAVGKVPYSFAVDNSAEAEVDRIGFFG